MTFIRLTLLVLFLMSLNIYGQTQPESKQNNKPQAYKFDEYKNLKDSELKTKLENFVAKILEHYTAQGRILIFAPNERRADLHAQQIRKNWDRNLCHRCDRFYFLNINSENERTEFWVIPEGANEPEFKSETYKFAVLVQINNNLLKKTFIDLEKRLKDTSSSVYIVFYATSDRNLAFLQKSVREAYLCRGYGCPKIVFVDGRRRKKQKVEFWVVPDGTEPPTFGKNN